MRNEFLGIGAWARPALQSFALVWKAPAPLTLPTSPNQAPRLVLQAQGACALLQGPFFSSSSPRDQLPRVLLSSHQQWPRLTWAARPAPQIPEAAAQPPTLPSPSRRRASAVTSASDPAPRRSVLASGPPRRMRQGLATALWAMGSRPG